MNSPYGIKDRPFDILPQKDRENGIIVVYRSRVGEMKWNPLYH